MASRETLTGAVVLLVVAGLFTWGVVSLVGSPQDEPVGIDTFESSADFSDYLSASTTVDVLKSRISGEGDGSLSGTEQVWTEPVAGTNVQEAGVGEPDIVKFDDQTAIYSASNNTNGALSVLDVSAPQSPDRLSSISTEGSMLLFEDTLVVVNEQTVVGYDVSTPETPEQQWSYSYTESTEYLTARRAGGSVYLVTTTTINESEPCPITPFEDRNLTVECSDIHHPTKPSAVDVTYGAFELDPSTGTIAEQTAVVGSAMRQTTYISQEAIYLTYLRQPPRKDQVNESNGLLSDLGNAGPARELATQTGIVKISTDSLDVTAIGEVPGVPISQFALDSHDGHLRIATTNEQRQNRLTVLGPNLSTKGKVTDIASGQRLTAVRQVGDVAFATTFRQKDPFHVIDLSDPNNPTELGEVRLPGEINYLHPVTETKVIGVGSVNGQVKATLFDVSTPTEPTVTNSVVLNGSSTALARTHHAFAHNPTAQTVAIPTDRGGAVLSYQNTLALEAQIETSSPAQRINTVDGHEYLFDGQSIAIVDQESWNLETTVDLSAE